MHLSVLGGVGAALGKKLLASRFLRDLIGLYLFSDGGGGAVTVFLVLLSSVNRVQCEELGPPQSSVPVSLCSGAAVPDCDNGTLHV